MCAREDQDSAGGALGVLRRDCLTATAVTVTATVTVTVTTVTITIFQHA